MLRQHFQTVKQGGTEPTIPMQIFICLYFFFLFEVEDYS